MINNYHTLCKLAREFKILEGCQVNSIFTQDRYNTIIEFDAGDEFLYLNLYQRVRESSLFLYENFQRARSGTNNILKELYGDILQSIELIDRDRLFKLEFIKLNLYILVIGNSRSNLILCDKSDIILDTLTFQNELLEKNISEVISIRSSQEFEYVDQTKMLKGKYLLHSNHIAEIESKAIPISQIEDYIKTIYRSDNYLYETKENEFLFSNIALSQNYKLIQQSASASELIRKYVSLTNKYLDMAEERSKLFTIIDSKLKKNKNILEHSERVLADTKRIETYRQFGNLLLSHSNLKQKGQTEIELTYWEGNALKVPLDSKVSISDNANKYFEKAKKASKEIKVIAARIPAIREQIHSLQQVKDEIESAQYLKELKAIQTKYSGLFSAISKNKKDNESTKFRAFTLIGDFQLFVGKNSSNNDELTMNFAAPYDIWLHARGIGGSHCVIRRNRNQQVPMETITQAAEIAAYYSQQRKASYVPVIYTEKKNIRKPKGSAVGAVMVLKEEVVMVEPKLPS